MLLAESKICLTKNKQSRTIFRLSNQNSFRIGVHSFSNIRIACSSRFILLNTLENWFTVYLPSPNIVDGSAKQGLVLPIYTLYFWEKIQIVCLKPLEGSTACLECTMSVILSIIMFRVYNALHKYSQYMIFRLYTMQNIFLLHYIWSVYHAWHEYILNTLCLECIPCMARVYSQYIMFGVYTMHGTSIFSIYYVWSVYHAWYEYILNTLCLECMPCMVRVYSQYIMFGVHTMHGIFPIYYI